MLRNTMRRPFGYKIFPFGRNDAEKELKALFDVFFDIEYADNAFDNNVTLLVGRRGAGKTALAMYLKKGNDIEFDVVIDIDKHKGLASVLREISEATKEEKSVSADEVAEFWESALWIKIMQRLLEDPVFKQYNGAENVRAKLHEIGVTDETRIFTAIRTLLSNPAEVVRTKGEILGLGVLQLSRVLGSEMFKEAKKEVMKFLDEGHHILVVIDTMEEYRVRVPDVDRALVGLLQTTTSFAGDLPHPNFQMKCFLPAEIYPYVTTSGVLNIRKVAESPIFLTWKPKELLLMLSRRLARWVEDNIPRYKGHFNDIDWADYDQVLERVWHHCFPRTITNRMKKQEETFPYIARHTQMHPGQIIWLCNCIVQRSYERGLFPMEIAGSDVVEGIRETEDDIANEILGSYMNVYPQVDKIMLAFRQEPNVFPASRLQEIAEKSGRYWVDSVLRFDINTFVRMALEVGFIGLRQKETDIYHVAEFEYHRKEQINLPPDAVCVIHPMFYKKYEIAVDQRKVVYPYILVEQEKS